MDENKLKEILDKHKIWLSSDSGERANLQNADLRDANLRGANLRYADLRYANLRNANLQFADLRGAKIKFIKFPSLLFFTQFELYNLPDYLLLELMRRDADAHPNPERFTIWSEGGPCPYKNEDRYFLFEPKRKIYKPGPPEMKTSDLILELCKVFGWKIKGYL